MMRPTTTFKFSHALTGPYLPLPGSPPGWPFAGIGHWTIDVNANSEDWIRGLREWRNEHLLRLGYDDVLYRDPRLQWAQRNFVHALAMIEDRYLYDPVAGHWTVQRYLDDVNARYGGIDSVLLWYIYPNVGVDDRNHFDFAHDLPGGVAGLREAVAAFQERGVKVFLPTMPWDNGTRPHSEPDWELMADLVAATGADGINGDTYSGMPRAFFDACAQRGHAVVLEPESTAQAGDHILNWNVQSWSKKVPQEVIPSVFKLKWLEPRHVVNIENRWSRDRNNDLQHMFFNGIGYTAWENVWGIWNQLTPRDAETLRRIAAIHRQFAPLMVSADWTPYEKTLQAGVFASRFPGKGQALWTIVNRNEYDVRGRADRHRARDRRRVLRRLEWRPTGTAHRGRPRTLHAQVGSARIWRDPRGRRRHAAAELARSSTRCRSWRARRFDRCRPNGARCRSSWSRSSGRAPRPKRRPEWSRFRAAEFDFAVHGIEIEGQTSEGLDVQYPWETSARRAHRTRVQHRRLLHRPPSGHECAVQGVSGRHELSPARRSQFPASLGQGRVAERLGEQACHVGRRSKTLAPMRSGPASACRTNGNGNTRRRVRMGGAIRGATSGMQLPYRRRVVSARCRRPTMSMRIRRARVRSV